MRLFRRLHRTLFRRRHETDFASEMRTHLQLETERRIATGEDPATARRRAAASFGSVDARTEEVRDGRLGARVEEAFKLVRHAVRGLRKSPGFTLVAAASLALGIGAGTAVFSVANAILLRSLPVPNPQQLRLLQWEGNDNRIASISGGHTVFTPPHFFALREQVAPVADLFGFIPTPEVVVRTAQGTRTARGAMVSDNFFSALSVTMFRGRPLTPGEDYAGAQPHIVISHDWWQHDFGGDSSIIGRSLSLNGDAYTIIGVAPPAFMGPQAGQPAEFYVPLAAGSPFLYRSIDSDFHWYLRILARLHPDSNDAQLQAALDVAWTRIAGRFFDEPRLLLGPGDGGEALDRGRYRGPLLLLLGVVGVVMLVACANLAGLLLARHAARHHEFAVRAALGAGRARLIAQALVESLLLALAGGAAGTVIALGLRRAIAQLLAGSQTELQYDFALDARVLAFTLALSLVAALLAGLLPALRSGRVDPLDGLKHRGLLCPARGRTGRILVAAQIGLSVLLLTAAGLYARTLINVAGIEPGFATDNILLCRLNISGSTSADADPAPFFARLQENLATLPGVRDASFVEFPLLNGQGGSGGSIEGRAVSPNRISVGETFFNAFDIPILRGRLFGETDNEAAPKVIVVNEAFVRRYAPDRDPIGLVMHVWDADWQVVGVCRDVKYSNLKSPPPPTAYFPFRQRFYSRFKRTHLHSPWFAVRSAQAAGTLAATVRDTVARLDTDVTVTAVTTQDAVRQQGAGRERLFALLCGALAVLALLLACIGLYGLLSYNVTRRTGEIGVRVALGARPSHIMGPILREALGLAAGGVILGIPLAFGLTRLIANQLYGVSPSDPLTLALAPILLTTVALIAASLPASRATRIDPLTALRSD